MADDIIKRLYNEMMSEGGGIAVDYSCEDLYDEDEKLWDKVRPHLDPKVMEELQRSQAQILFQSNLEWFRRGVRTGMLLMQEIL